MLPAAVVLVLAARPTPQLHNARAHPADARAQLRCTAEVPRVEVSRVAVLAAVPVAWGTYSPVVRVAFGLEHAPPAPLLSLMFSAVSLGGLVLSDALLQSTRSPARAKPSSSPGDLFGGGTLRAGLELGMWLFLGSNIQLQGLARTDAARAGFIVQLTTVLVPLGESLLLRRPLPARLWPRRGQKSHL